MSLPPNGRVEGGKHCKMVRGSPASVKVVFQGIAFSFLGTEHSCGLGVTIPLYRSAGAIFNERVTRTSQT